MNTDRDVQKNKIGIRELKQHTSEVMRRVRENNEPFYVTYRGEIVAQIVPAMDERSRREKSLKILGEIEKLAQKIKESQTRDISAVEAVREQRREF